MNSNEPFWIQQNNIYAVPILHYNMEMTAQVRRAFEAIQPDCIAVELAETMHLRLLHAASRLPDISIVMTYDSLNQPIYYLCEPCDPAFEALRSGLEAQIPSFCIDLDVDFYPDVKESLPDPYAITRIGLNQYYNLYKTFNSNKKPANPLDTQRELYMAKRLKELSFSYEKILFIGGMAHVENVLKLSKRNAFPTLQHSQRDFLELYTLTEHSCREILGEYGWVSKHYEEMRSSNTLQFLDRQHLIYQLYKKAAEIYMEKTGNHFPGYHHRNLMKFVRNYALICNRLMPDLFQVLSSAKGCVDHNYAYEVWELATAYPYRKNVDGLPEVDLSVEDMWGNLKHIHFHLKQKGRKNFSFHKRKDPSKFHFQPPGAFGMCSYPPEDVIIEQFGDFLKKKGTQILMEETAHTIPFSGSLEDGIDTKETIRHWQERKIFVKTKGKPPGAVGSVVVIFNEDCPSDQENSYEEKYSWRTTWLGEHNQESDMAFYATPLSSKIVGPGISRCEYGGFMMSYPPRRLFDIWSDPDYEECRKKSEVLLMAAIDYAVQEMVVYVAASPPRSFFKSFARRYGKTIVYIPMGQLSPITINKLRAFHVLDGQDKRKIADEYIY